VPDFLDFLDPVAADAYRRQSLARQQAQDPTNPGTGLSPDEEESFLSHALDQSLGGLAYVGKVLDKPRRAVGAGLSYLTAGGNPDPSELLSFLPGSDTLGLTHEQNAVQGTDVLSNLGLVTKGDNSWENQAAGFAAELAMDPLTYLGIGPLTKAGQAAAKAGTLAGKTSERIAAGQAKLFDVGLPFQKALFGADRVGFNPLGQDASAAIARNALGAPLQGLDVLGRGAEKYLGGPVERLTGSNPVTALGNFGDAAYRYGRTLFDPRVAEASTKIGQTLAETEFVPRLKAGRDVADANFAAGLSGLDDYAKQLPVGDRYGLNAALVQNAEGYRADAEGRLLALGYSQPDVANILAVGDKVAGQTRATLGAERALGVVSKQATDVPTWAAEANKLHLEDLDKQAAAYAGEALGGADRLGLSAVDRQTMDKALREEFLAGLPPEKLAVPFPESKYATQYFPRTALAPEGLGIHDANRLSGVGQFQDARSEIFRGVPGGTLGIEGLVKDPYLSTANRTAASPLAAQDQVLRTLTGHGVGPVPPSWQGTVWGEAAWDGANKQAKELAGWLERLPEKAQKQGMFNLDYTGLARARQADSARVIASGETVMAGLRQQARPLAELQKAGVPAVSLDEALNKAGLTHVDHLGGAPVAKQALAEALGVEVNELKNMAVPADVAKDMFRIGQMWRTPEAVAPIVEFVDRLQNLFKGSVTSPFPAFHVRNVVTGVMNMARGDALSFSAGKDMLNVLRGGSLSDETIAKLFPGLTAEQATKKFRELLVGNNVAFTRAGHTGERIGGLDPVSRFGLLPGDLPEVGGAVRPVAGDVGQYLKGFVPEKGKVAQQLNPFESVGRPVGDGPRSHFTPIRQGEKLGNTSEDWIRGTHFLGSMLHGSTPAEAKLSTMKYQIDYSDLTQFEKNVMRRIFPWYTFTRRNLPPILEDLASSPGKIAAPVRLATGVRDPGQFAPQYVGEGASVPIPGAPDGFQRYISSFGLPIEDEGVKLLGSVLKGDAQRTAQVAIGMANPLVKAPFELATGRQMYSGRRLEDLRPSEVLGLGGLLPEDVARQLTQVVANSPASRAVGSVDKLLDPRKDIGTTLLNLATGVQTRDVETAKEQDIAARGLVKDALIGTPGIRTREEVYAPVAERGNLDPTQRFLLELLKSTDKKVQDRAAMEKAQGGR
jgi:hypothetical protein